MGSRTSPSGERRGPGAPNARRGTWRSHRGEPGAPPGDVVGDEHLRVALAGAAQGIWDWDVAGDDIVCDARCRDLLGLQEAGEIDYARLLHALHPDDRQRIGEAVERALVERGELTEELRVPLADGSERWIVLHGRAGTDEGGTPSRMSGTVADDTARCRAEEALRESERRFRSVLDNSFDCIYSRDLRSRTVEYVSPAITRITGYTVAEAMAMSPEEWTEHVHPDDRERRTADLRAAEQEGHSLAEYRFRHRDGSYRWLADHATVTRDERGNPSFRGGTIRDVTVRKRVESDLLESTRRKDEFLAVLSHELRGPLAPLRSSLAVLDHAPAGSDAARRARGIIDRQVAHLSRLVDDLLDLNRVSRGKVQLERQRCSLNDLVARVLDDHRADLEARGVAVWLEETTEPLWLDADPTRICQVVGNLLDNAAKFTPSGGQIDIVLGAVGDEAVLRVRDSGEGIPPALLEHVFEPFTQAHGSLEHGRGGLGLGLALVKGMVELHGGTVAAQSAGLGRGAEMTVRLPAAAPPTEAVSTRPPERPVTRRLRLLVIEDNVDAADSLRDLLELMGHDVHVANDGPDGIAGARLVRPEVVLCDIGLPGMDGYEVAAAMRRDPELTACHLVALSGYAQPDDIRRATEAGFADHLAKPPSVEDLERLLARVAAALALAAPAAGGAPGVGA